MMRFERPFQEGFDFVRHMFTPERATVVIPCFNERENIGRVARECLKSQLFTEVIVVDDGSSDGSAEEARQAGARVVRHRKNKGKGAAIKSGATAASNSVLVFIDADLQNFTYEVAEKLAQPVLANEAKLCKSAFERDGGRVTELTAKPLLEMIFPEMTLVQPLSGQFAIRKETLLSLDLDEHWGIDISIALSSLKSGERIVEENIGRVEHKHRPLDALAKTSRDVARSILQNAGLLAKKHKLVVFDFDGTLVSESSIIPISKRLGIGKEVAAARERYFAGKTNEKALTREIAMLLSGVQRSAFRQATAAVKKRQFAEETLVYLRRMGYRVACVSYAFDEAIYSAFKPSLFDAVVCPSLGWKRGACTGRAMLPPYADEKHVFCKGRAVSAIMRRMGVRPEETIAVGDSRADEKMFGRVGMPVSIGPMRAKGAKFHITSIPEILIIAN